MKELRVLLENEQQTQRCAQIFAAFCKRGIFYLRGDLGAGKTTFSQAFIKAAGFSGKVKSPTYTLVEPYELAHRNIYHFDLYRLQDEEELLFLGCDEYFEAAQNKTAMSVCLIEWPEKAGAILPRADIELRIAQHGLADLTTRTLHISPISLHGTQLVNAMQVELQSFERV